MKGKQVLIPGPCDQGTSSGPGMGGVRPRGGSVPLGVESGAAPQSPSDLPDWGPGFPLLSSPAPPWGWHLLYPMPPGGQPPQPFQPSQPLP